MVVACSVLFVAGCGDDDPKNADKPAGPARTEAGGGDGVRIAARGFEATGPRGWGKRDDLLKSLQLPESGSPITILAPEGSGTVESYIQVYEDNEAGAYDAAAALFGGERALRERACEQTGQAIGGAGAKTGVLPVDKRPGDTVVAGCTVRTGSGSMQYRYVVLRSPVVYNVVGESQTSDPEGAVKRALDQLIQSVRVP